jgi:hypothetical protein
MLHFLAGLRAHQHPQHRPENRVPVPSAEFRPFLCPPHTRDPCHSRPRDRIIGPALFHLWFTAACCRFYAFSYIRFFAPPAPPPRHPAVVTPASCCLLGPASPTAKSPTARSQCRPDYLGQKLDGASVQIMRRLRIERLTKKVGTAPGPVPLQPTPRTLRPKNKKPRLVARAWMHFSTPLSIPHLQLLSSKIFASPHSFFSPLHPTQPHASASPLLFV